MIVNGGKHRKPETLHADWRFAKALGVTLSSMGVVGAIAFTSVPKPASMTVRADVEQPETEPAPEVPYVAPPLSRHPMAPVADVRPLATFDGKDAAKTEVRAHREHRDKPKSDVRARDDHHDRDHHDRDRGGRHRADHQRRAYDGHGHWPGAGRHHRDDRDRGDREHRDRDRGGRDHGRGDHGDGHGGGSHGRHGGVGERSHGGHGGGHGGGHHGRD